MVNSIKPSRPSRSSYLTMAVVLVITSSGADVVRTVDVFDPAIEQVFVGRRLDADAPFGGADVVAPVVASTVKVRRWAPHAKALNSAGATMPL